MSRFETEKQETGDETSVYEELLIEPPAGSTVAATNQHDAFQCLSLLPLLFFGFDNTRFDDVKSRSNAAQ